MNPPVVIGFRSLRLRRLCLFVAPAVSLGAPHIAAISGVATLLSFLEQTPLLDRLLDAFSPSFS